MTFHNLLPWRAALFMAAAVLAVCTPGCSVSDKGLDIEQEADGSAPPPPPPPDGSQPPVDPDKKPAGSPCSSGRECERGFCAQGVCCNSACNLGCFSCVQEGLEGTCAPIPAGTEPRLENTCRTEEPGTCGLDGTCNGEGGCRQYPEGTACGQSFCAAATETPAPTCNGQGACIASEPRTCAPYICGARACAADCRTAADCTNDTVCLESKCQSVSAPLVRFTVGQPQVDGLVDDAAWTNVAWTTVMDVAEGSVGSPQDLQARYKVLWTREALFVALEVEDSSLTNDSGDPAQDDAVVIGFDPNNSRGQLPDQLDDVLYVFGWDDDNFREVNLNRVQAVTSAFRDRNNGPPGYGFEARIPWATIGVTPAAEGFKFGFQVGVIDDDQGNNRDAVVLWKGMQREALTRPGLWGQLILGPS